MDDYHWSVGDGRCTCVCVGKEQQSSGSYEVVTSLSRGDDTSVYYQIMRKGMIRYSKDGMAMTDKSGNLIWTQTYEMTLAGHCSK